MASMATYHAHKGRIHDRKRFDRDQEPNALAKPGASIHGMAMACACSQNASTRAGSSGPRPMIQADRSCSARHSCRCCSRASTGARRSGCGGHNGPDDHSVIDCNSCLLGGFDEILNMRLDLDNLPEDTALLHQLVRGMMSTAERRLS